VKVQPQCLPEAVKAHLLEQYDGKAAAAYREVVIHHAAAPHVEDAKERLAEMNLPIPVPTKEEVAASDALEGSRAQYTMAKRLELLFLRTPDTVVAATAGDPPLDDPPATTAPQIVGALKDDYRDAFDPKGAAERAKLKATSDADGTAPATADAPVTPVADAPLAFSDVPTGSNANTNGSATTMQEAAPSREGGTGVGVEVLSPTSNPAASPSGVTTPASTLPAATGAPDPNNGLNAVGPKDAGALPPVEQPAAAPDQVNDVAGQQQPTPATQKSDYDKADESSSKHQPKKGVDKLNPF
jgi:outer membrane protein assembly factor BamD